MTHFPSVTCRIFQTGRKEFLYPGARDDVRALGFASVQLDRDLPGQHGADLVIDFFQSFLRQVAGEEDDGAFADALLKGYVFVAVLAWNNFGYLSRYRVSGEVPC